MLKITAYSDKISCVGGETLDIKVSAEGLSAFDAELVRIIQGDINPEGPGYRVTPVSCRLGGPFRARTQKIRPGSYGVVSEAERLATDGALTVAALIWPTAPGERRQTILSGGEAENGFRLFLDAGGAAGFEIARDGASVAAISPAPCRTRAWYVVIGSFDPVSGEVRVFQNAVQRFPGIRDFGEASGRAEPNAGPGGVSTVLIGAAFEPDGFPGAFFNGKIEAPEIHHACLPPEELLDTILADRPRGDSLVARWDFSADMENDTFADRGPLGLGGTLINLPHRAVAGFRWNGEAYRWSERPDHYAAVHFHDDDLYDAGWETDFEVALPDDLASGVYAVRLFSQEDSAAEYFVVFAVRAKPGAVRKNAVVFVLPTGSYMAYANHRLGLDVSETEIGAGQLLQLDQHHLHLQQRPEYGLSLYEVHNDGSGVFYSSRLRPVLDLQPKVQGFIGGLGSNVWQFNADTHILGFLEDRGIGYDVVTDEDLDGEGEAALAAYQVVITGTHPEYTSTRMLDAYEGFLDRGGRLMYLGGNGFYWRIAYNPKLPGVIECRRSESGIRGWEPGTGNYWHQFTDELGGLWRRIGRAPQQLFGVGMTAQGFDLSSPYIRTGAAEDPRASFILDGVEANVIGDYGLNGNGAAGNEIDRTDFALGTPPHALVVATSRLHTDVYLMTPEDLLDPTPTSSGTQCDLIRSDMTFFETPAGGAVFSVGSIAWAGSMAWNGYDNDVARITENVLRRFADPTPFAP